MTERAGGSDVTTMTFTGRLTVVTCICGINYAIPEDLDRRALDKRPNVSIYCPLGHKWHYTGETEVDRLKRYLDNERARTTHLRDQLDTAEARRRAEKAAKTRIKNRIAKGVCPCCNRLFVDLERHMSTKHPDYTEAS